jgi:mercuric ion transport protein
VTLPVPARAPDEQAGDGDGPTLRSRVTAAFAVLACALPLLIGAGLLTGAGAALAEQMLLAMAGLLIAAAAGMWWLHRRRAARAAHAAAVAGGGGCGGNGCGC